jgi:hypothetical protein
MCRRVGDQTSNCKLDKDWQFKYDHKADKAHDPNLMASSKQVRSMDLGPTQKAPWFKHLYECILSLYASTIWKK